MKGKRDSVKEEENGGGGAVAGRLCADSRY